MSSGGRSPERSRTCWARSADEYGAVAFPARNFIPREGAGPILAANGRARGAPRAISSAIRSNRRLPIEDARISRWTTGINWVAAPGLRTAPPISLIEILHYPIRSYEQFERKVVNHGEGYEALESRPPDVGSWTS